VVISIVTVGLATLAIFSYLKIAMPPGLNLKTCFQDASGLQPGAVVRLAGVDIGRVRSVRAQATDHACPAAVGMQLQTDYELKIPRDSVASITSEGLLRQTFLQIDASGASGPAVESGGQLPSKESVKFTAATADRLLKAVEVLKQISDPANAAEASQPATKVPSQSPAKQSAR